jgi:hypothetical protein
MNMLVIDENDLIFSYLAVYARWIVGAVLLFAGAAKGQNMSEFVITIRSFRILPKRLSQAVGLLIVGLELILGPAFLLGIGVPLIAFTGAFLFGCFTAAILVNLVRQNMLDCNCFGPYFKETISAKSVLRNLVFVILCLLIWRFYDGYLAVESWLFGRATLLDHPFEPFFLLSAAIIITLISILIVRTVLKNFRSVT